MKKQALLLREYKNGTYSLLPFYLATLLNAVVFNAFYAIFLATYADLNYALARS